MSKTGLVTVAEQSEATAAVGKMLSSMEGMQEQLSALTNLVIGHEKTIENLTKRIKQLEFGPAPVVDIRNRLKKG